MKFRSRQYTVFNPSHAQNLLADRTRPNNGAPHETIPRPVIGSSLPG